MWTAEQPATRHMTTTGFCGAFQGPMQAPQMPFSRPSSYQGHEGTRPATICTISAAATAAHKLPFRIGRLVPCICCTLHGRSSRRPCTGRILPCRRRYLKQRTIIPVTVQHNSCIPAARQYFLPCLCCTLPQLIAKAFFPLQRAFSSLRCTLPPLIRPFSCFTGPFPCLGRPLHGLRRSVDFQSPCPHPFCPRGRFLGVCQRFLCLSNQLVDFH